MSQLFSPGKLLITSEYAVLDGALALALPTKLGQEFFYKEENNEESLVYWSAFHQDVLWLSVVINYENWEILETNNPQAADFVVKVLQNVQKMSSSKFQTKVTYQLSTNLQFPANYGLGSSSTLMNNLADWANVDPFELNEKSLGGSGYDIAVAREKSAILYQLTSNSRKIEKVDFNPVFKDELIFIHLNQKQDSREGIQLYKAKEKSLQLIDELSSITTKALLTNQLSDFDELMRIHELELSKFLGLKTVKEQFFADCPVFVKSLGAWGGDFVMSSKFNDFEQYFSDLGFSSIFNFAEIIE